MTTPRRYWTTAWVRAEDLDNNLNPEGVRVPDVARIEGRWRWIYGVNEEEVDTVKAALDDLPETRVVVRYALDEKSERCNYEDAIIVLDTSELVEVQVPLPPTRPIVCATCRRPIHFAEGCWKDDDADYGCGENNDVHIPIPNQEVHA